MGAALLDALIVSSIIVVVLIPLGATGAVSTAEELSALDPAGQAAVFAALLAGMLYAPLMMWRTNGKTLGRMATGIRVVRSSGDPMSFGIAAIREILIKGVVVGFISQTSVGIVALIDVLWPLWDRENRALHDFPVDTRVVID